MGFPLALLSAAFAVGFGLPAVVAAAAFERFTPAGMAPEAGSLFTGCSTAGGEAGFVLAAFAGVAEGLAAAALGFVAALAMAGFAAVFAFGAADLGETFATAFVVASAAAFPAVLGDASFDGALAAALVEVAFAAVVFIDFALAVFFSGLASIEAGFAVGVFARLPPSLVTAFAAFSLVVDPPWGFFANSPSRFVVAAMALPPGPRRFQNSVSFQDFVLLVLQAVQASPGEACYWPKPAWLERKATSSCELSLPSARLRCGKRP